MTTSEGAAFATPGWFGSGDRLRFGWMHVPGSHRARAGVVICPPFFSDVYPVHTTLRALAEDCAERGLVALRFDYFATGDSSGDPADLVDVEEWADDVRTAVAEIRNTGVAKVAVVGMRAAGTMVAGAAQRFGADALVVWDPVGSGRTFLRSLELVGRWEAQEEGPGASGSASDRRSAVEEALTVTDGFPSDFISSVSALRLTGRLMTGPALILTRSGQAPQGLILPDAGVAVEVVEGQEDLLEVYLHDAAVPNATVSRITAWLIESIGRATPEVSIMPTLQPTTGRSDARAWSESPIRIGTVEAGLFGIVTDATSGSREPRATCLFLNSGVQHHIGPDRLYVDAARRLAVRDIRSVRLDLSGLGDSPTRSGLRAQMVYSPMALNDLDEAVENLGSERLVVAGLCSGGYHALEAAARHPIAAAVSIHTPFETGSLLYDPETAADGRRMSTADSMIVHRLRRSQAGRAILWRLPGPAWWLLDKLRVQRDVAQGHRRAVAEGRHLMMIIEAADLTDKRSWASRRRRGGPIVVPSLARHSLGRVQDRDAVTDILVDVLEQVANGESVRPPAASLMQALMQR